MGRKSKAQIENEKRIALEKSLEVPFEGRLKVKEVKYSEPNYVRSIYWNYDKKHIYVFNELWPDRFPPRSTDERQHPRPLGRGASLSKLPGFRIFLKGNITHVI